MNQTFDWSLVQSFLAALDQGSLLGAARALNASQPTIGRHIAELESQLGVVLFERTGRGLLPTAMFILRDFIDGIPKSYEESAMVAGASPVQAFFDVALPVIRPGIVVIVVWAFVNIWGSFLIPFILLRSSDQMPASVAIYSFYSEAGTPIVTLADLDHVWLRAYVNETDIGKVRYGQSVAVTTDTYPGKTYRGRISFISSRAEFTPKSVETHAERVTLVYRIRIDIENTTHELVPGLPADARISALPAGAS